MFIPGIVATPNIILNTLASFFREKELVVRAEQESIGIIVPMYNEEDGAKGTIESLLGQTQEPGQIVISVNGGTDDTYKVVISTLENNGFIRDTHADSGNFELWSSPERSTIFSVINRERQTAKSDSVNDIVETRLSDYDRIMVVDGDTLFDKDFIRNMSYNFYRLKRKKNRGSNGNEFDLEKISLQSGSVTSYAERGANLVTRVISLAREGEYAFGQYIFKRGQSTKILGRSRMYTVTGCGFIAGRDNFPMSTDTKTEDHDFTLKVQSKAKSVRHLTLEELASMNLKVVMDGKEVPLEDYIKKGDTIRLSESGNAILVENAHMHTKDPSSINGLIAQLERWNGGGIQNALKRIGQKLPYNSAVASLGTFVENIVGLGLVAYLPASMVINYFDPTADMGLRYLASYVGLDFAVKTAMLTLSFYRYFKSNECSDSEALAKAVYKSAATSLPFYGLSALNAMTYITSGASEIYKTLKEKTVSYSDGAWSRPHTRQKTIFQTMTPLTMLSYSALLIGLYFGIGAKVIEKINNPALLISTGNEIKQTESFGGSIERNELLPTFGDLIERYSAIERQTNFTIKRTAKIADEVYLEEKDPVFLPLPELTLENKIDTSKLGLYELKYCNSSIGNLSTTFPSYAELGNPDSYQRLDNWELMVFTRLIPLTKVIHKSAEAWNVSPDLVIRILINESAINPVAVGPTEDYGLGQVTADAESLITSLATIRQSPYYYPNLVEGEYNIWDPEWNVCASVLKYRWASDQEGIDNPREAYALYINPLIGLNEDRELWGVYTGLTERFGWLDYFTQRFFNVFAAYEKDSALLSPTEKRLVEFHYQIMAGTLSTEEAYEGIYEMVKGTGTDNEWVFKKTLNEIYDMEIK